MNERYNEMVNSVAKYGGFWVARYETSLRTTTKGIIQIQSTSGKKVMTANWYDMYYNQESKINSNNPYYNSKLLRQFRRQLWLLTES